jgi:hypothetical protein
VTASVVLWSGFLATDTEVPGSTTGDPDFLEVMSLQRGPHSLVKKAEELLEKKK